MIKIEGFNVTPQVDEKIFTPALFGAKIIRDGRITIMTDVRDSMYLNQMSIFDSVLQKDSSDCAWTPKQNLLLSEKMFGVKTWKVNEEQCIKDLEKYRTNVWLNPGANQKELPQNIEETALYLLQTKISLEVESKIFTGDSATNADDFDGAVAVLSKSADAIKIKGVTLNRQNVLDELDKVYVQIPTDVLEKGLEENSMYIYMSPNTHRCIRMSLPTLWNSNNVIAQNITLDNEVIRYMGVELVPVKSLDDTTMIAAARSNFILGTDLVSDLTYLRFGQFPAPYDSKVFFDGRLRLGFVIVFEDECVFYNANVSDTNLVDTLSINSTDSSTKKSK